MKQNFIPLISLFGLALILGACSGASYNSSSTKKKVVEADQEDPERDYGMQARTNLSASQIYSTMLRLTGVPKTIRPDGNGQTIDQYFTDQRTALPTFVASNGLSTSHFNAIANLAERFCKGLTMNADERMRFYAGTDIENLDNSDTVSNTLGSATLRRYWAEFFINKFWATTDSGLVSIAPFAAEMDEQIAEVVTISGIGASTSTDDTLKVLAHACTAALSAAPVVLN